MITPIRVLIVDDQRMFREGIRAHLEQEPDIQMVGEAASAEQALDQIPQTYPSIVVLDIRLPGTSGIETARLMRQRWPDLKILILTGYDFEQYVRATVRIGIQGYLLKDAPQEALTEAIRTVAGGEVALPPTVATKLLRSYAVDALRPRDVAPGELTVRELEVLELMHEGHRNAEIGDRLSISARTVEGHVSNIIAKLGAQTRTEAVRLALEGRLIK